MAIVFDGSGSEFLTLSSLIATPPISVSAWFYVESTLNLTQRVFSLHGAGPQMHECRLNAAASTIAAVSQEVNSFAATTANTWNTQTWHHGLWTFDDQQRTATLDAATTAVNTDTRVPTIDSTGIAGPSQALSGRIAKLAVWNVDLHEVAESDKIKRALARGFAPMSVYPANLVAWMRFLNGEVQDVVGGFVFTVNGSPDPAEHPRTWNHQTGRLVRRLHEQPRVISLGGVVRPAGGRIVLAG